MTKLDLIKLIIGVGDDIFEELKNANWDVPFVMQLLRLGNISGWIGDIDRIGYIEIDNDQIYVEPKCGYELTSLDSCSANSDLDETTCLSYHWKIKKGN